MGELTAAQDAAITATGKSIHATQGKKFTKKVATFHDGDAAAGANQYSASIKWGDGSTSTGKITGSGGKFTVTGTHAYKKHGSYKITVTITDKDNKSNSATAKSSAKIGAVKPRRIVKPKPPTFTG